MRIRATLDANLPRRAGQHDWDGSQAQFFITFVPTPHLDGKVQLRALHETLPPPLPSPRPSQAHAATASLRVPIAYAPAPVWCGVRPRSSNVIIPGCASVSHPQRQHVVFGKLLEGFEVLRAIEAVGSRSGVPSANVTIVDSGLEAQSDEGPTLAEYGL